MMQVSGRGTKSEFPHSDPNILALNHTVLMDGVINSFFFKDRSSY